MPRDHNGTFEPLIVPKKERRLDGFDDRILSLYARGMTVREIRAHLQELYGVEVSPDLISRVTDAVLEEVREWQNRPLDAVYPVVFFDALRLKIRDEGLVRNKATYLALAITCQGEKEVRYAIVAAIDVWSRQARGWSCPPAGPRRSPHCCATASWSGEYRRRCALTRARTTPRAMFSACWPTWRSSTAPARPIHLRPSPSLSASSAH